MSGASQYMLTGRFSPEMWQEIRKEPGHPLAEIVKTGEGRAVTVEHFFYALDDNDFYTVLNAADAVQVWMLRNELMAGGGFGALYLDPLYVYADLVGARPVEQ